MVNIKKASERKEECNDVHKYETGAVRSKDCDNLPYDLISPIGLRRVAEAHQCGRRKGYPDFNWEKGMPVRDFLCHAIRHIFQYLMGNREEDHLGHAAWNLFGACHSEELWPHLNKAQRDEDGNPPI